jgi:O-antigen/teichoic acid export membrane protein
VTAHTRSYRRFVLNVFASAGGRVAAILLAIALATVLVRALGLAGYGTWSFFYAAIGYAALFDLGLSIAVERTVARFHHDDDRTGIERTINLGLSAALALSLLLQGLLALLPDHWLASLGDLDVVRTCMRLLPLCLFFSNVSAVTGGGLSGLQDIARLNALRVGAGALTTLGVLALALAGVRSVPLLLVCYSTGLLATGVAIWGRLRAHVPGLRLRPFYVERELAMEFCRFGGGVQLSNLALQLGDQLLRALLGARFGAAAMGAYDLAARAGYVLRSLCNALLGVMVPFGTAQWLTGGRDALSRLHALGLKYSALFMVGGTMVALLEAQSVLDLWLRGVEGLPELLRMLQVTLALNALQSLAGPIGSLGRAAAAVRPEAVTSVAGNAAALLAASSATTPVGAVLGFMSAIAVANGVQVVWLRRLLGVDGPGVAAALRIAGTLVLTAVAAWSTDTLLRRLALPDLVTIAGTTLAAALALAAGAVWLRVLGPEEQQMWRALLARRRDDGG